MTPQIGIQQRTSENVGGPPRTSRAPGSRPVSRLGPPTVRSVTAAIGGRATPLGRSSRHRPHIFHVSAGGCCDFRPTDPQLGCRGSIVVTRTGEGRTGGKGGLVVRVTRAARRARSPSHPRLSGRSGRQRLSAGGRRRAGVAERRRDEKDGQHQVARRTPPAACVCRPERDRARRRPAGGAPSSPPRSRPVSEAGSQGTDPKAGEDLLPRYHYFSGDLFSLPPPPVGREGGGGAVGESPSCSGNVVTPDGPRQTCCTPAGLRPDR